MNPLRRALARLTKGDYLVGVSRQVDTIAAEPDSVNRQRLGEQLAAQWPSMASHIADFLREIDGFYAPYSPEERRKIAQYARLHPPSSRRSRS